MTTAPELIEKEGILFLVGTMTLDNAIVWRALGEKVIAKTQLTVKINFSKLGQTDMSVLSVMMCWLRLANSLGIKLLYLDVPNHVLSVSGLYGIREFLPIV